MSNYKDFSKCVVCRSMQNLRDYNGEFEVTMLLNTLYLSVMQPIEKRANLHIKATKIAEWLKEKEIVNKIDNDFSPDDLVRMLRNGLAHFNIEVNGNANTEGQISNIIISAKAASEKPHCKNPCQEKKCIPTGLNRDADNNICKFSFTLEQLREFTKHTIEYALHTLPDVCEDCTYKENLQWDN